MQTLADKGGRDGFGPPSFLADITYEQCIRLIQFDMIAFCSYLECNILLPPWIIVFLKLIPISRTRKISKHKVVLVFLF